MSGIQTILSTFSSDLNWIYSARDPEVGRIADQNWMGSTMSRVNARRVRAKSRSDTV